MNDFRNNLTGVFELEDDGTILHSRPDSAYADPSMPHLVGRNFFDDVVGSDNDLEFRRHFRSFINSRRASDSFTFKCSSGKADFNTKVHMTRAFQTAYCPPMGIVMLEIRNL